MARVSLVPGLLLSCILAVVPTPGFSQLTGRSGTSLTGTVFAQGGDRRIENATVTLCDNQGSRLLETMANQAGEFSFSGIRAERYILQVRAEGFAPMELSVDLTMNSQHGLVVGLQGLLQPGAVVPDHPSISARELAVPEAARALMSSGMNRLYKEKNAQAALHDFQSATKKAPAYYEAYYQAGMAYLSLQNEAEAEKQFRKALERSEQKYGDADIALGTLLLGHQQERDGEMFLRQGLALNPQSWPGQVELGKLELARGHLPAALAAGEKAASLAPLQPMVYRLLALVHIKEKDYPALLSDLDRYIRLDPDSPAGVRAKELRAQIEQQVQHSESAAAASATSK